MSANIDYYSDTKYVSVQAERAILSSMMNSKNLLLEALPRINTNHFYFLQHQELFLAIKKIHEIGREPNIITISDYAKQIDKLEVMGGYLYLMDLFEEFMVHVDFENSLNILEDKYQIREFSKILTQGLENVKSSNDFIKDIISEHIKSVSEIDIGNSKSTLLPIDEGVSSIFQNILTNVDATVIESPEIIIPTGYSDLDGMLMGGTRPSNLIIIAARPSMGKTSFALNIAVNMALNKHPVAIFSSEMDRKEIEMKIVSGILEMPTPIIRNSRFEDHQIQRTERLIKKLINDCHIRVDDRGGITPEYMRSTLRKWKSELPKDSLTGGIFVDYLQLMRSSSKGKDDDFVVVSKNVQECKLIAKEMGMPMFVLSQLSRTVEQRQNKRPILSDLRSTGEIEQTGDIIMFIYRDEYYNPDTDKTRIAEINIAKHRNGPVGTIEMFFKADITKFFTLERNAR